MAVVQPGVVYAALDEALKPYGFFYPPDPASSRVATLGGNVATNAGGVKGAKYGTTRDYVLGLEVVLADGTILRPGVGVMKCSSGYDLVQALRGFRRHPGGGDRDYPQDQSQTQGGLHLHGLL